MPISAPISLGTTAANAEPVIDSSTLTPTPVQAYRVAVMFRPAAPLDNPELLVLVRASLDAVRFAAVFAPNATPMPLPVQDFTPFRAQLANLGYPDGLTLSVFFTRDTLALADLTSLFDGRVSFYTAPSLEAASLVFSAGSGNMQPPVMDIAGSEWLELLVLPNSRPGSISP